MRTWNKLVALLLTIMLAVEALPVSVLADSGTIITETEIQTAMLKAGLQQASWATGSQMVLESTESGYHDGMKPDGTWGAQLLLEWLDDMLKSDIYHVTNTYVRAGTLLEKMMTEDPASYRKFTSSGEYDPSYMETCRKFALDAETVEEKGRYIHARMKENTVVIQQNIETLVNDAATLFDSEKLRLSAQIREACGAIDSLKQEIITFSGAQMQTIEMAQAYLDGNVNPGFSRWIKEVLDSEDGPTEIRASVSTTENTGASTLMARLSMGTRALADGNSRDVRIRVITENDFAIVIHGKDNQPVAGVQVRVKDLNGKMEQTLTTDDLGSVVYNANDFVCDYDKEMELSLWVEAEDQGYRSFYVPWLTVKRGGHRTETLALLSGPETQDSSQQEAPATIVLSAASPAALNTVQTKPYIYSAAFNGYDILRADKTTIISRVNDAQVNFEVIVDSPPGKTAQAPILHYWAMNDQGGRAPSESTQFPTSSEKISDTRTKYIYRKTWKSILSPDITKEQKPYFILPDTGEKVKTTLMPVRSSVDTPAIAGTEPTSPLSKVVENGFGFDFTIPGIGGKLALNLPFINYLPKVAIDPTGYVTITFGSSLVDPGSSADWKTKETEKYDKEMKNFQHATSVAQKKQQLGTATQLYKKMGKEGTGMGSAKFDFGWFLMLSGRKQKDSEDKTVLWSASGMAGFSLTLSAEYTQPFTLGPFPFYVSIAFSASLGFGMDSLQMTFYTDSSLHFKNFHFEPLHGFTIQIRLALTATLGFGIKGVCSAWIAATGALNIVLQIITKEPVHIAVYCEMFVSVGFEVFFIKYSKTILKTPSWMIYSNYNVSENNTPFRLFTAYAEDASREVETVSREPERYTALTPQATKIMDSVESAEAGIKVVEAGGETYLFYIEKSKNKNGVLSRKLTWRKVSTGQTGIVSDNLSGDSPNLDDYGFDVMSQGKLIAVAACSASAFETNQQSKWYSYPKEDAARICYFDILIIDPDYGLSSIYDNALINTPDGAYDLVMNPRIEAIIETEETRDSKMFGTFDAISTQTGERGFFGFDISRDHMDFMSDQTVQKAGGDDYERIQMRSDKLNYVAGGNVMKTKAPSPSFIALTRPRDQGSAAQAGKASIIELYDYDMNVANVEIHRTLNEKNQVVQQVVSTSRKAVALTSGNIDHMEVIHEVSGDGNTIPRMVFYMQTETVGDRTENRLKSIHLGPKQGGDTDNISFEITYSDYDLSLPSTDFRTVTLGGSRYLYWLTTAPKEKETDPDTWRIIGVYYDAATGAMSDELVIAEFTLPNAAWKGKSYPSVPFDIMLTESGKGYITAKPNTENEADRTIAPLTLYSFPITLKPVLTMKSAALIETTVCQGEIVATDFSLMNEGNMGIGSFDIDLILLKDGKEAEMVETLHADCVTPGNSSLILKTGGKATTELTGEHAFYRVKDLEYSPKQHEWLLQTKKQTLHIQNGTQVTTTEGSSGASRVSSNVLVPGALGGYTGSVKIPADWNGVYDLRLKITRYSTYSNWLAAEQLAADRPELFASDARTLAAFEALASPGKKVSFPLISSASAEDTGSSAAALQAAARQQAMSSAGIQEFVYELDEEADKMVLRESSAAGGTPEGTMLLGAAGVASEAASLYATEVDASDHVAINCSVNDIDISHRLYSDYYGDEMLEITIVNYATNEKVIRLSCAVYVDDADTPYYVSLSYDPESVSMGMTQTLTVPLEMIVDPEIHQKARIVILGIGIDETALVNNEFTLYFNSQAEEAEMSAAQVLETPPTGDRGNLALWMMMMGTGLIFLFLIYLRMKIRKRRG